MRAFPHFSIDTTTLVTIQAFKDGRSFLEVLRSSEKIEEVLLDRRSFQRAFLINWILGKQDDHIGNTIYCSKTREIFEIDNELLGNDDYYSIGVFREFTSELAAEIDEEVIEQLLSVNSSQFTKIQEKYTKKDLDFLKRQRLSGNGLANCQESIPKKWKIIIDRFILIQTTIRELRASKSSISIQKLRNICIKK